MSFVYLTLPPLPPTPGEILPGGLLEIQGPNLPVCMENYIVVPVLLLLLLVLQFITAATGHVAASGHVVASGLLLLR